MPPPRRPSLSEEFLSLLKNHVRGYIDRVYRSGQPMSQEQLARKLGYSRYALGNWLNGTSSISAEDLDRLCVLIGLSVKAQHELFQASGYQLPPRLTDSISQGTNNSPRYQTGEISDLKLDRRSLGEHLFEWKIVHTAIQEVFLKVSYLEPLIYGNPLSDQDKSKLIKIWFQMCEGRLRRIVKEFKGLSNIKHESIDEFYLLIPDKSQVLALLLSAREEDSRDHSAIQNAVLTLKSALDEILRIADLVISEIATLISKES